MKMVLGLVAAFFYFNFVTPVQMYYIYDETPNVGFVGDTIKELAVVPKDAIKAIKDQPYSIRGTYSVPIKYGIGRRFPKENGHPIDSHFKVLKTSTSKTDKNSKVKVEQITRISEATNQPPNEQRKYIEDTKDIEPRPYQTISGNTLNANSMTANAFVPQNYGRDDKMLNGVPGVPQSKTYHKMNKDNEPYIINVHKTQITSGQKVKLSNNQYGTVRRVEGEHNAEKANLEEVNAQAKGKYDQINKKLDRRHYDARDYRNNNGMINNNGIPNNAGIEATATSVMNSNTMNNINMNNVNAKKLNVVHIEERKETPRIGSWEETLDDMKPYALFYRVNQEQKGRQSYMGQGQHFINEDDGEIKTNKFIEQDVHALQPTTPPNTVKLRMKMKKYSNFRSH